MTRLAADFHLHLYKVYPLETLLRALFANLNRLAGPTRDGAPVVKAAFLAERRRYRIFQDWHRGLFRIRGFTVRPRGPHAVDIVTDRDDRLLLFAGRQIATAEGLEILSLVNDREVPDALPFPEAAARVLDTGGIPVLPWAPGKWSGSRHAIVRQAIVSLAPRGLLLCDSSIRPAFFPEPSLFHLARRLGVPIVAGTDPFPVAGEETLAGSYGSLLEADFTADNAPETIPGLLRERSFTACRPIGRRSPFPIAARRWLVNMFGSHRVTP